MIPPGLSAVITKDLRMVGIVVDDQGLWVARFTEDVPPDAWRQALFSEWDHGDGASVRAALKLAKTYELEGFIQPSTLFDPTRGDCTILGPLKEE